MKELVIETVVRGSPRILYKWYKDCREIVNDDKYLQTRNGEIHRLLVNKPSFRDSGVYLISGENDFGIDFLRYEIEFEEEHVAVHGFIHHADLTKTKKYHEDKEKKRQELIVSIQSTLHIDIHKKKIVFYKN